MRRFNLPDWVLVFLLFLFFSLIMFGRSQEYSYADGSLMFNVAKSIAEDGSFKSRVPGFYRGEAFIEHSKYGLGFSIITVPFYIGAKILAILIAPVKLAPIIRLAPIIANMFITALTCAILYAFSYKLFQERKRACIITALYGFATIAWPYSRYDFAEPLTGLCLLSSVYTITLFQETQKKSWLV